ncbi:MAG: glycosyltransferase family 2 protein [Ruminococcaceae bacterium]|nr:glycosyltransferase family 2 protein [Oscillospiraceae bacterium]
MKISVIVPAYNSEKFISETIDCLLSQTLSDIQIIIVNDGSTDGTGAIIERYASKNPNILTIHQDNSGVSAARNNGINHAEGKYIMFLDSDDLLSADSLEQVYNKLEETNADMAIWRILRFGYGGDEFNPVADSLAKDNLINCFDKRLLWNFLLGNKCFRTDIIKKSEIRFPPLRYSEDGAFIMQLIYKQHPKITGVFSAVYHYRRHTPKEGFSVSQSISGELVSHFSQSLDIVYNAAQQADADEPYLQEIIYKTYFSLINEFYRILWRADNDTVKLIGTKCRELEEKMTAETLKKCREMQTDIGEPIFDTKEIVQKPVISVIAKNPSDEFISSVYAQSMPIFEIISAKSINKENAVFLPSKQFGKSAKKVSKGKIILKFKGNENLDSRLFKIISMLKKKRMISLMPDFLIKFGAALLLKLK